MVRIRTKREINLIAESCQIVADTVEMLAGYMKPGVSHSELDKLAEDYIRSRGARPAFKGYMGFPSTLCISVDDEVVHGIPSNRLLENGQIVGVDCGDIMVTMPELFPLDLLIKKNKNLLILHVNL